MSSEYFNAKILTLSCSFEFLWCDFAAAMSKVAAAMWFLAIASSPPNYTFGCFVVGVVVVVGL